MLHSELPLSYAQFYGSEFFFFLNKSSIKFIHIQPVQNSLVDSSSLLYPKQK